MRESSLVGNRHSKTLSVKRAVGGNSAVICLRINVSSDSAVVVLWMFSAATVADFHSVYVEILMQHATTRKLFIY